MNEAGWVPSSMPVSSFNAIFSYLVEFVATESRANPSRDHLFLLESFDASSRYGVRVLLAATGFVDRGPDSFQFLLPLYFFNYHPPFRKVPLFLVKKKDPIQLTISRDNY